MNRLHVNLRKAGVDSKIICENKTTNSSYVTLVPGVHRLESRVRYITSRLGLNDIHRLSSFQIKSHEAFVEADILHFHGTHSEFMNYLALASLTKNKPAVFTLHDMWCFTGHCVYSYDCIRWKTGCGNCPYLNIYPKVRRDNTRLEWKLKNWVYKKSKLSFVSLSDWMTDLAKESMISPYPIFTIPHGVDTEIYKPLDQKHSRSLLNIPTDKKVLIFLSVDLDDPRKGGDLLISALHEIPPSMKKDLLLLVLGKQGESLVESACIPTIDLGYVSSDRQKAVAYSAADLLVFPTRADAFGLVSIESQACGTPVVSFRINAIPEHVRHGITGYLAQPDDSKGLCEGIIQLLENNTLRTKMSKNCQEIALREYSIGLHIHRHIELYQQLLDNNSAQK